MAEGLDRFVEAQAPVWADVLAELGAGRKESHWMWFVFPQLAGLGRSAMSQRYALGSVAEAADVSATIRCSGRGCGRRRGWCSAMPGSRRRRSSGRSTR